MLNSPNLGPIQPHTEAKHDILRYHLGAWFPILSSRSERLQYIDGFAGPGRYDQGESGSPIIALDTVAGHRSLSNFVQAGKRMNFLFVEKEREFAEQLRTEVLSRNWPNQFDIEVLNAEFESVMSAFLDEVESGRRRMFPTLLFIDLFGSAGFPMNLLARLSHHDRIDMLINFNYLELNRWLLPDPTKHITLDRLYGSQRWQPALELDGDRRKEFLIREYGNALRGVGWQGTNFEMINRYNQTQYYLYFATRSYRGMQVIKSAMRSVSPDGLFRYLDRSDPAQQRFMGMGMDEEYARELAEFLHTRYRGQEVNKDNIVNHEVAWHPRWIEKDLTAALRLLENSSPPRITNVRNTDGRPPRRTFYPTGCLITFSE